MAAPLRQGTRLCQSTCTTNQDGPAKRAFKAYCSELKEDVCCAKCGEHVSLANKDANKANEFAAGHCHKKNQQRMLVSMCHGCNSKGPKCDISEFQDCFATKRGAHFVPL